ncbi:glycosyltransferase family 4 protein, partial [Prevotella koreensis]
MAKRKLIRVTTSDISLDSLIKGQLKFLSSEFEVIGVSNNTGVLAIVGEREGIRTIEVPMHREISLFSDIKCLWLLYRLFRKEKPDIVHANTPKGSMLSMIASKLASVPHRFYTVTGLRYQGASGLFRTLLMTMERISCYCATKVIPEGEGVKKTLLEDNITSKEMHIIHNGNINGIDTTYFSEQATIEQIKQSLNLSKETDSEKVRDLFRESIGLSKNDFAFIFIGRIVNDKGMHELAGAFSKLVPIYPHCKLILVGNFEHELDPLDSKELDFLQNNRNVKLMGYQRDVRPFLLAADVFTFPSYREGFPNVVMQAGSMGLASIVTNINGCNEIIKNGENGIII